MHNDARLDLKLSRRGLRPAPLAFDIVLCCCLSCCCGGGGTEKAD